MSNTIYNGSYPSIAENYVYSSTGTSKVKTKSDAGSNTAKTSDTASIKDTSEEEKQRILAAEKKKQEEDIIL